MLNSVQVSSTRSFWGRDWKANAVECLGAKGGTSLPKAGISSPGTQANIWLGTRGSKARHEVAAAECEAGSQRRPAKTQ